MDSSTIYSLKKSFCPRYVYHFSSVSKVHHFGGYPKMRYKKLVFHVESHVNGVGSAQEQRMHYIKVINNNSNIILRLW